MKSFSTAFVLVILMMACHSKNNLKTSGTVKVKNGRNLNDTLHFTCDSCERLLTSTLLFDSIITLSTAEAKTSLKNPFSFIPSSVNISLYKSDSLYYYNSGKRIENCIIVLTDYKCIGKNAYGTEGEVNTSSVFYIVNGHFQNLSGKLKRPDLGFSKGGIISRTLTLQDHDETFTIQPTVSTGTPALIVKSESGCSDKGDRLKIDLEDGSQITLINWNSFNCDATGYYNLYPENLEMLKKSKIKWIWLGSKHSLLGTTDENETDYFMQLAILIARQQY